MKTPIRIGLVAATAGAGVLLGIAPAVADSATVTYAGSAYGSAVRLGTLVQSGRTSFIGTCTPTPGVVRTNNTAAIDLGGVGHIGAVATRVSSVDGSSPASTASAKTDYTSLFRGAITAQTITATASVTRTSSGYVTGGRSYIVGLTINGHRVSAYPAPNTSISLAGIGRVILNRQVRSSQYGLESFTVTAITVVVQPNNGRGLPAGSIDISSATGALHRPTFDRASGSAWGTSAQVGSTVRSGDTALVSLPCGGSNGQVVRNKLDTTAIPNLLHTGTVTTSATSTDSATATTVKTTAQVEGVNLLNGQVRSSTVTTRANAVRQNGSNSYAGTGTSFVRLVIGGRVIQGSPPRNTAYSLAGIGTVYVNVVTVTGNSVRAQALKIVLGSAQGGLPAGAVINVAVAIAGVTD